MMTVEFSTTIRIPVLACGETTRMNGLKLVLGGFRVFGVCRTLHQTKFIGLSTERTVSPRFESYVFLISVTNTNVHTGRPLFKAFSVHSDLGIVFFLIVRTRHVV